MTPKLLNEELKNLKREDATIYVNHFKPVFAQTLLKELREFKRAKKAIALTDGAFISL
ncbi:MAG: hypothetical protein LBI57_01135 [Helicobacteraceae bacterium]|nr:hypothetical protein [Helicobacteraceae bacterium]